MLNRIIFRFNNIVNKAFKSVDTNNSGDIDFTEFEYLVRKIASEGDIEEINYNYQIL